MSDEKIEQMIKSRGLNAPRVTLADVEANIKHVEFVKHVSHGGGILRWAVITTANGYAVTGEPSAAVSVENDNREIGEKIAYENAVRKIWPFMGYALKEHIFNEQAVI